jgi:hypothetical protein
MKSKRGRCEHDAVTEGVEVCLPPPEDKSRRNAPQSYILCLRKRVESQTEGHGANWVRRNRVNVAKYTVVQFPFHL